MTDQITNKVDLLDQIDEVRRNVQGVGFILTEFGHNVTVDGSSHAMTLMGETLQALVSQMLDIHAAVDKFEVKP